MVLAKKKHGPAKKKHGPAGRAAGDDVRTNGPHATGCRELRLNDGKIVRFAEPSNRLSCPRKSHPVSTSATYALGAQKMTFSAGTRSAIVIIPTTLFSCVSWAGPSFSEGSMGWSYWRATHAQDNEALSDLENLVKLAAHSKPFADGKGGLDAEEISRAIGSVGSHALVDALLSLQRKNLLLYGSPANMISTGSSSTWSRPCEPSPSHSRKRLA